MQYNLDFPSPKRINSTAPIGPVLDVHPSHHPSKPPQHHHPSELIILVVVGPCTIQGHGRGAPRTAEAVVGRGTVGGGVVPRRCTVPVHDDDNHDKQCEGRFMRGLVKGVT
jgi:hypothetical protein